ncbi:F-box domain-containing protein [Phlyctema vagabunda]|uniref:F-box domain-containing protein n=1 Tax=Phlyctema vagabunda TaxID=108571 RepID=A0ABR4PER1_9HELO
MSTTPPQLPNLPDELLLLILSYLDVPDLLAISRVAHHLRHLSTDPVLHMARLRRSSLSLSRSLSQRRSLAELMQHRIYITRTSLAARALGRNLIKIKLNRALPLRPTASTLVEKGVLPRETTYLAPSLIETKRRIERERVKDVLRHWIEEWRKKGDEITAGETAVKPDVRRMVRRFARGNGSANDTRWGSSRRGETREMPTRAKVLGLRRFWEKVGREGIQSLQV